MTHEALVAIVEQWLATHEAAYQTLGCACIDWLQAHVTAAAPGLSDEARVVLAIAMLEMLRRSLLETLDMEGAGDADA